MQKTPVSTQFSEPLPKIQLGKFVCGEWADNTMLHLLYLSSFPRVLYSLFQDHGSLSKTETEAFTFSSRGEASGVLH